MVHIEILTKIVRILIDNGHKEYAQELEDSISYAATSTELMMQAGDVLGKIRRSNTAAYSSAKSLIDQYFEYCRLIGLYFS